jgi:hypothetical protein
VLFGVGMVLAGGCVSRLLVLAASGNGRSLVTLIVIGVSGYATLRGLLSYPRIWLGDAADTGTSVAAVYQAGAIPHLAVAGVIGTALLAMLAWTVARRGGRGLLTGTLVGLAVVAGWAVTGIIGFDEFEPTQLQSLSFVAPVGESLQYLMIFTGVSANYVIALLGGVLAGAFGSALIGGRVRFKGFQSEGSLLRYIAGGVLMGFGGVTALGCSVGQGLSGLEHGVLCINDFRAGHRRRWLRHHGGSGSPRRSTDRQRIERLTASGRVRLLHSRHQKRASGTSRAPCLILMSLRPGSGEHVRGD